MSEQVINPELELLDDEEEVSDKLTDWENEPDLNTLKNDLTLARPSHDAQMGKITHWKDLLNLTGPAKPPKIKGRSSVQPRLVRTQAEWRYSALTEPFLSSDKIFQVLPRTFEDADAANQNEVLLNYQFDTKLNKVKFIDDVIRSVVNEGTCVIRTGWERETTMELEEQPVYRYLPVPPELQQQVLEQFQQAAQLMQANPRGFEEQTSEEFKEALRVFQETQQIVQAVPVGSELVPVEKVITNQPTAEVLNLANVYVDPTCNGDASKAYFIITSFETSRAELSKDGRYVNLDKIDWESNTPGSDGYHISDSPTEFKFKDEPRKKVVAYEYWGFWDIHNDDTLRPIVVTWIGNTIIRMEENPFPDGKLPFVFIPYLPLVHNVYGEPDAALLEENQRIIGALTRGMVDLLGRSANSQQGIRKGLLDPVNERRFKEGKDYMFNTSFTPVDSIIEHKYPEIPQSAITMLQLQQQDAEALTGVKAFNNGISAEAYGSAKASATAVRGALDAASKREMAILRRIAKGVSEIGEKFIAMNGEFLSDREVIRVTNRQYIYVSREDLKGNFDLKVDISTSEVENAKAQDLGFMLQTLGNTIDPTVTMKILARIADLKRLPDLAETLRNWQPPQDPLAEEMKQLQIEEQKLKNEKLKSEIALNNSRSAAADAGTESTYLQNQLEASGVKHQQDMEKQQAQARANQNLEVTKALLKGRKPDETEPDVESAIGYNSITPYL